MSPSEPRAPQPSPRPPTAVVFAYHNVGVRCLEVLLKHGVDVKLVVTHQDNPHETIWFDSVAAFAQQHGIPAITPEDANIRKVIDQIRDSAPDFLFSFYYRQMLGPEILALPTRGAFNMHGSLLPKYRGRVPINWAILKGETETGATLHEMVAKPDAGRIVDQQAVPIGPDEQAAEVFAKVTAAAAAVLDRSLPKLIDGSAVLTAQDLAKGSYFSGRKPEDGIIDWTQSARDIHNLVRAVAPPYPGATTRIAGKAVKITRTQLAPPHFKHHNPGFVNVSSERLIALCGDGCMLRVMAFEVDGVTHTELDAARLFTTGIHALG